MTSLHLTDETLFARLDGALPPAERESADEHLAACRACDARSAAFEALFTDLATPPESPAPHDFTPMVMSVVRERSAGSTPLRMPSTVYAGAVLQLAAALTMLWFLAPSIAGTLRTGPALPDPIGWLEILTRPVRSLPVRATAWFETIQNWIGALDLPALIPVGFNRADLITALGSLVPLIVSSGLLWLVGNAILIRKPGGNTGERS